MERGKHGEPDLPSIVRLNVGGTDFATTVGTLTQRDHDSMLAVMFSGRHPLRVEPALGTVFIDRDGTQFRHVLNWLRNGALPAAADTALYHELLAEAEYYQLRGLMAQLAAVLKKEGEDENQPELTRKEVIVLLQGPKVRLRGVNLCGEDLSKLDLQGVDFSYGRLVSTFFSRANLTSATFRECEADQSNFHNCLLKECDFEKASLRGALLAGCSLQSANMQDACLVGASLLAADLRYAHLENADLSNANLSKANLEGANLKGARLTGANLQGANLQRAYLRDVDLRDTVLEGANLGGANLQGATR